MCRADCSFREPGSGRTSREYEKEVANVAAASSSPSYHYHLFAPQCGQGARTTRRHSTPLWAEISCWQWRQSAQCSLFSSRSSAASYRQSTQPATAAGSSVKTAVRLSVPQSGWSSGA